MPTEIRISYPKMEKNSSRIEEWLKANAGKGSLRFGGREGDIKHWLNGDDWLYYNCYSLGDQAKLQDADTVFIFKNEQIATEFALRFS